MEWLNFNLNNNITLIKVTKYEWPKSFLKKLNFNKICNMLLSITILVTIININKKKKINK